MSGRVPAYPLLADTSLYTPGGNILDVVLGGTIPNQSPVAEHGGPYSVEVNSSLTFDGSASHDPDGLVTSYAWDFGDGGSGTGVSPSHTYTSTGNYTVTLTVQDQDGATGNATTDVTVTAPLPSTNVVWTNLVRASASGNDLTKTGTSFTYDAGASSTKSLPSGNGYVEFTMPDTTAYRLIGLSNGDTNQSLADVDFGIFTRANGTFSVMENGAVLNTQSYAGGDRFRRCMRANQSMSTVPTIWRSQSFGCATEPRKTRRTLVARKVVVTPLELVGTKAGSVLVRFRSGRAVAAPTGAGSADPICRKRLWQGQASASLLELDRAISSGARRRPSRNPRLRLWDGSRSNVAHRSRRR